MSELSRREAEQSAPRNAVAGREEVTYLTVSKHQPNTADTKSMAGKDVNRESLERLLGSGQPYAIAQVSGLKAAVGWSCGCRAIEHDDGIFTLIACGQHQGSEMRSASMLSFQ